MFNLFTVSVLVIYFTLYIRGAKDLQFTFILSVVLATFFVLVIFFRELSPEYIAESLKQGNGYRFFI